MTGAIWTDTLTSTPHPPCIPESPYGFGYPLLFIDCCDWRRKEETLLTLFPPLPAIYCYGCCLCIDVTAGFQLNSGDEEHPSRCCMIQLLGDQEGTLKYQVSSGVSQLF